MRFNARFIAFSLVSASSFAIETPDALLERVIRRPGNYSQNCDIPDPVSARVPFPIYRLIADREILLDDARLFELRARRNEVIPVLVARLSELDLSKPIPPNGSLKSKGETDEIENSGINPRGLSGVLYEIILGLDAVETLPELLRIEEQLRGLLAASEANAAVSPPPVAVDGYFPAPRGKDALSKRDAQLHEGRVIQRELLSVMLQLLRRQGFQPVLDSPFEKTYAAALKKRAREEDLRDFKTPADALAAGKTWMRFDTILHLPIGHIRPPLSVPFSAEVRNSVRGFATDFIAAVPREKWKWDSTAR